MKRQPTKAEKNAPNMRNPQRQTRDLQRKETHKQDRKILKKDDTGLLEEALKGPINGGSIHPK